MKLNFLKTLTAAAFLLLLPCSASAQKKATGSAPDPNFYIFLCFG